MNVVFTATEEREPGPKWARHFERRFAGYRDWFLAEGDAARASYLESRAQLRRHMPELVATYERLCELAGGGDLAARLLALYRPPPYLSGCSQAVWPDEHGHVLVRNYDYHPALLEGAMLHTAWNGRRVIAMSDCLWGAVDGVNEDGLAVSLAFGGNRIVGDGFGIPLVLRYVLEFCTRTAEACAVLARVPVHMAYNVTVVDREDQFRTVYLSPGKAPVMRQFPVATNHQGSVEWMEHAHATQTLERERYLFSRFANRDETAEHFVGAFLAPPLFSRAYRRGYGTLYTAIYRPALGEAQLRWPGHAWTQRVDAFVEGTHRVDYVDPEARAPSASPPPAVRPA